MAGSDPLLSVRNLMHRFSSSRRKERRIPVGKGAPAWALRGVSLELREGECLGLVGESGSGKTTLARCVLRLLEPTAGEVLYRGRDVLAMSPGELQAYRREAQIVFQDPFGSLNPRIRVGDMLGEVLKVHGLESHGGRRGKRVDGLLETVGLDPEHGRRFPHEFSGGQRQRLGIARALAVEPGILVLDEPVSALDLSVQAQILNLLRDLQRRFSLTYLFIAHDLAVVRNVAHRVAVLYAGTVVEEGRGDEVFRRPRHPYTRRLLAAAKLAVEPLLIPGEAGDVQPRPDEPGAWETGPTSSEDLSSGCPYQALCPHPDRDGECETKRPSLEPVQPGHRVACWKAGV